MIDRKTVELIYQAASVVEVVGEFTSLKKRGTNFLGLCPFHNERTPSFHVSPAKEIYKCFGCGKSGGVVQFLMDYQKLSYVEALRWLAQKYGIAIVETEETAEKKQEKHIQESLYIVNSFAQQYFAENLTYPEGQELAWTYLVQRGFNLETIQKFGLGYADSLADSFLKKATNMQYDKGLLLKAGLINQHDQQYYDNYRKRIIFPIFNISQKIVGFGARVIQSTPQAPKYINTPENEIYHKGSILYGLNFARPQIVKEDNCILVEGYTDVIQLHQAGITNVVSSSGTALTEQQLKLIKKSTSNLTIIYDGDAAGIKASVRGLDLALGEALNVYLVLLPSGDDPDSFVNKVGAQEFQSFILENKKDFVLFMIDIYREDIEKNIDTKNNFVNQMAEIISKIDAVMNFTKRDYYCQVCAEQLDINLNSFVHLVNSYSQKKAVKTFSKSQLKSENLGQVLTEIEAEKQQLLQQSELQSNEQIFYKAEKELLTILIEFGGQKWTDNEYSAYYILSKINGYPLEQKDFCKVFDWYIQYLKEYSMPPQIKELLNHEDVELRQIGQGLVYHWPIYSSRWSKEEKNFSELIDKLEALKNPEIDSLATTLKNKELKEKRDNNIITDETQFIINNIIKGYIAKKIKKYTDSNLKDLKNLSSDNESNDLVTLKIHGQLREHEKNISDAFGRVIRPNT